MFCNPFLSCIPRIATNLEPCRILYVVGQLSLGGLERQLHYLLANMDRARYQPALVVWNLNLNDKYYKDIQKLKVPIYGFPPGRSPLSKLQAFRALARQVVPEVIHSYGFHTNFAAYFGARGTKTVAIGSLRSDFTTVKSVGGTFRGALNARWPDFHISNSAACAEAAHRNSSFFMPRQFCIVRNGLDLNSFRSFNKDPKTKTYIAAIGSLFPVKRWDRLLMAVREVWARIGSVHLRIAGDGPLRSALGDLARKLGVTNAVTFMGPVDDIPDFLQWAKFLVHTSESEGCPNVVMEAMACGLPVVAMETGDIPCLVEDGHTGFLIRQDDERGLADRMTQLLTDECLCIRMGAASREKAERDFSLQRLTLETLSAYKTAGWKGE